MEVSSALTLFLLIASALIVLCLLYTLIHYYRIPKGIPFVRQNSREHQLALQLADIYKNHREYPIIGMRLLRIKPCLVITDLELVRLILVDQYTCFQNRGLFYNEVDDPLSAILGTVDHDLWKPMRKKVAPAFRSPRMKDIFPRFKNVCDELVAHLNGTIDINGEQEIDILDKFSRCTTDAIGEFAFGNDNKKSAERLREMVTKSKQPYLKFPFNRFVVAFPKAASFLGMRKHPKEVTDFFLNFVSEIVQYRSENNIRVNDFMQSFIDAELGKRRIAAIAFDLLSAGYADSTSTLAYCLYELALNKDLQDRARAEIKSILENQEFTYDMLQKMSFCDKIIKEAERKYPVAGIATRVATKECKVPNTEITIPCGMKVFIPIYGIHHDERYYPDPEVFNPNREAMKNAFLPFGAGPRKCIGYKFAEMIIGIGLVSLLQNFEFSTSKATQIPLEFNPNKNTLHPRAGVILKIRRI